MSVLLYNDVKISDICFDNKPYKKIKRFVINNDEIEKSVYYIDISYRNSPLYIQIPKCMLETVDISDNLMTLIIDNSFYENFIECLENYVIQSVYSNSEKWFFGRRFTMNKIVKCLVSLVDKISDERYRLSVNLSKDLQLYDKFKNKLDVGDLRGSNDITEIVCVLLIDNLQFVDNMFTINITVEQAKLYLDTKLIEYSIIDSESQVETVSTDKETDKQTDKQLYKESDKESSFIGYLKKKNETDESSESVLEDEYYKEDEYKKRDEYNKEDDYKKRDEYKKEYRGNRITQNFF